MIKIKMTLPNGNTYHEWVEDDSTCLRLIEEYIPQEVQVNPEDTSPTQYCSSGGDISYREINDSPPSGSGSFVDIHRPTIDADIAAMNTEVIEETKPEEQQPNPES